MGDIRRFTIQPGDVGSEAYDDDYVHKIQAQHAEMLEGLHELQAKCQRDGWHNVCLAVNSLIARIEGATQKGGK